MSFIPRSSRSKLKWHMFEQTESGDWMLALPPYYATLFEQSESYLMGKSKIGWRQTKKGNNKRAFFRDLREADIEQIRQFITDYEEFVILGLNKHIKPYFHDELDSCMALDYNLESVDVRTDAGELEYQAKYHKSEEAIQQIVNLMLPALSRVPRNISWFEACLCYVPPETGRHFYLPRRLCELLCDKLTGSQYLRSTNPIVDSKLLAEKVALKDLQVDDKVKMWESMISSGSIELSSSVEGCAVYIVDDLYQSGTSMWSFAKFLKSVGASEVRGLVVVKSWRDSSNV